MPRTFMLHPCSAQEAAHYVSKAGRDVFLLRNARFCVGVIDGVTIAPRMIGVVALGLPQRSAFHTPYITEILALEHDQSPDVLPFLYSAALNLASALGHHWAIISHERHRDCLSQFSFRPMRGVWATNVVAKPVSFPQDALDLTESTDTSWGNLQLT